MSQSCLFCNIIAGNIPSTKVFEDDRVVAIRDINPAAPLHLLIIPKEHIATTDEIEPEHEQLIGHIYRVASRLAKENALEDRGYRVVNNCGEEAGQTVFHIHFHLLGGRPLGWPPG